MARVCGPSFCWDLFFMGKSVLLVGKQKQPPIWQRKDNLGGIEIHGTTFLMTSAPTPSQPTQLGQSNLNLQLAGTYRSFGCILRLPENQLDLHRRSLADGNTNFDVSPAERWGAVQRPVLS